MRKYIVLEIVLLIICAFLKNMGGIFNSSLADVVFAVFLLIPIFCMLAFGVLNRNTKIGTKLILLFVMILLFFIFVLSSIITLTGVKIEETISKIPFIL